MPADVDGVTVIVAVSGVVPLLTVVKPAILPVPLAARPIDGLLLVQLKTVAGTEPLKVTAAVVALRQTVWLAGWFTSGSGLHCAFVLVWMPSKSITVIRGSNL